MAGKKGRCAQCNGVNLVPVLTTAITTVTAVDVKRVSTGPNPFRNADLPVRGAIEKVVELAGVRFAATPTTPAYRSDLHDRLNDGDNDPTDFFDQLAPHLGTVAEDFHADVEPPPIAARPASRVDRLQARHVRIPDEDAYLDTGGNGAPLAQSAAAAAIHVRRAVFAALFVGAILGFCAGLLASKWIL